MQSVCEATKTNTYNGWTTRETWLVNLWLGGEECYYYELQRIMSGFDEAWEQAEEIEQYVRLIVADLDKPGLIGDLLNTSLGRVDWLEIVEANRE